MVTFSPVIRQEINDFIKDETSLRSISDCFGKYVNVLFPEQMNENINSFKSVFKKHHINGKIYFAHKTNKSNSLVAQAEYEGINIDVASVHELNRALTNGFTGDRIEVTGPKSSELICLAIKHSAIINIDNIEELNKVIKISSCIRPKNKVKILLRFSGFKSKHIKILSKDSKFGIHCEKIHDALKLLQNNRSYVNFLGFSFHLDTVEIKEKAIAIENLLNFFEIARDYGFDPYVLDIGGGFKVNYIKNEEEWNEGISKLKETILGKAEKFTWGNQTFGLQNNNGVLRGTLNIYNYFNNSTGGNFLDSLLSTPLPEFDNRQIGTILSENMIDLYIEPGRSLLDQVGITVAKINAVKPSANGDILAVLNIRRSDIVFADQEIFVDPVIISKDSSEPCSPGEYGVYLTGSLCLESDFVYRRKIFLNRIPQEGDIVVFVNTGGYFMDFNLPDSSTNHSDIKIAVTYDGTKPKWCLDENYNPTLNKLEQEL